MHPDEIGPYRITKKIGSGGMGNVYHGVHQETGQEVAVKVLPASMTREGGFVRRFSREIEAMRQLDNPYIVRLFEDGQAEDGSYFYSMEFVDGETLTSLISRRRKLPWDEVIDLASQIATALKAAHDAGIIHRDLKPSNLMVGSSGKLKLTDFGVADIFAGTRLTRPGGVVGTAEYMSPEQARGKRATKHSDLYSLGAVMYVMIAGRPPFTGKQASEIMHQHQVAQFDRPSHYAPSTPRLLEELVCRLLEKKPDDRLPDALVVLRQLENIKGRIEFEQRTGNQTRVLSDANTSAGQTIADRPTDQRGPATLVRDVMRNDIAESRRKSPVAAFFDNTLVLVAMLAGLIFLAYSLSRRSEVSPAEQFAEAKAMMEDKPGPKWVRARNDFLVPLLKSEVLPDDQAEIQHLIQQVEDYEFCRGLKPRGSGGTGQSELHRLIQRSIQKHSNGDGSEAVQQMRAIQNLLAEDRRHAYLATFVDETLMQWDDMVADQDRREYFQATLAEIRKQIRGGHEAAAADKLNALKTLYGTEASVEKELEQTSQLLQSLSEKQQP